MKKYSLPPDFKGWIEKYLNPLGFSLQKPKALAKAILETSDNYQNESSITDWSQKTRQAAYLSYFFPLNYIRTLKVLDEAKELGFFSSPSDVLDYGCGPGTATKALLQTGSLPLRQIWGVDRDQNAGRYFLDTPRTKTQLSFNTSPPAQLSPSTVVVASYVLNEMNEIPAWLFKAHGMIILEPSTKQAAKSFQDLRRQLIEKKYNILAPCPHMGTCPMENNKKDWCHDRVYWDKPPWFDELESQLPIKNSSLTFSYLIASRAEKKNMVYSRVVGDALVEKGKTRWMICRSEEREFISFLKRHGQAPLIYRGEKLQIQSDEKKGQEIRINHNNFEKLS